MFDSWFALTFKMAELGFEAQNIVALRLMRLAAGGSSGQAEATRMVGEKISALGEAHIAGTTAVVKRRSVNVVAQKIIRIYEKRIRANRRRLSGHRGSRA
jgi:hypothetical protein